MLFAYPRLRHEVDTIREWPIYGGIYLLLALPFIIWHLRAKRLVRREQGRLCGNCLFPLKCLPMHGDCPECCQGYSIKHTIACWKHDLGLNGRYEYRHWPELPKDQAP